MTDDDSIKQCALLATDRVAMLVYELNKCIDKIASGGNSGVWNSASRQINYDDKFTESARRLLDILQEVKDNGLVQEYESTIEKAEIGNVLVVTLTVAFCGSGVPYRLTARWSCKIV